MIEQLETIIRLLTEINTKLTPMGLPPASVQPKKETKAQRIHRLAVEGMPELRRRDAEKAKKMFAPLWTKVEKMQKSAGPNDTEIIKQPPIKKETKQQRMHREGLAAVAAFRVLAKARAKKMFAKENTELEELERSLQLKLQQLNGSTDES